MHKHSISDVNVVNLIANIENPRYELVGNQQEAIEVMIHDQKRKLLNLAEHILGNGVNPSELPIVAPYEDTKHFIVLEGNRRIVALKLLHNPEIVKAHKAFYKKIKPLANQFSKSPINKIPCAIFNNPTDADEWIELKHTGENDGVGTVAWNTQQKDRFESRRSGKSSIAMQAIDFLQNSSLTDDKMKAELKTLPVTNFERLLTDKNVQTVLGVVVQDGRLRTDIAQAEVHKGLSKVARDLIGKKIKVKDIYTKEDRENYILKHFKPVEVPNKNNKAKNPWELASLNKPASASSHAKMYPSTSARKTLIPRDCILLIKDKRINDIYKELRWLDCEYAKNAVAVLFRVFLELSLDHFIAANKQNLAALPDNVKLAQKFQLVTTYFSTKNIMNSNELKPVNTCVSSKNNVLSIDTFHAYVHNWHMSPVPSDLKIAWDNLQLFVTKLWA